jgi:predicted XRE-type DNA-binding protein
MACSVITGQAIFLKNSQRKHLLQQLNMTLYELACYYSSIMDMLHLTRPSVTDLMSGRTLQTSLHQKFL